jgi:hypothetical protein
VGYSHHVVCVQGQVALGLPLAGSTKQLVDYNTDDESGVDVEEDKDIFTSEDEDNASGQGGHSKQLVLCKAAGSDAQVQVLCHAVLLVSAAK